MMVVKLRAVPGVHKQSNSLVVPITGQALSCDNLYTPQVV